MHHRARVNGGEHAAFLLGYAQLGGKNGVGEKRAINGFEKRVRFPPPPARRR